MLDKDLGDRRRTAEIDVAPLLGDSYAARIQVPDLVWGLTFTVLGFRTAGARPR